MDKAARAAWVAEIMKQHARSFQNQGLNPDNHVSIRMHQGDMEIYGTSDYSSLRAVWADSALTPPALIALMKRAQDIPYEGRRPNEFLGISIYLDGTMRIAFNACNNVAPVYYPEEIEKQVLAQLS